MSTKNKYKFVRNLYNWFNLNHYRNLSLKRKLGILFFFTLFNFLIAVSSVRAQSYSSEFISPVLKTVQFHREGWSLSRPIIRLDSEQRLFLSFDEPGSSLRNYQYTIVLCDADWNESDLMTTEFIRGIPVNPILDYSFSFNVTFDFVHYRLTIPNENIKPIMSGNYVLKVFEGNNQDNPVLIKKFMVADPQVTIVSKIKNTAQSSIRASHQEINFEITHPAIHIHNPMDEISVTIMQNGRTDNMIQNLKPQFIRDGFMDFYYNRETLMEGGNEFRYMDIRSNRFFSDRIQSVDFMDPFYHVTLFPDFPRNPSSYQYRQDLNGRFFIEVQERDNPDLEADYMFVHFRLKTDYPQPSQKIYLNGALTNWLLNDFSEMVYNPESNAYEKSLLLKQGYYNYQYLTVEGGELKGTLFPMENSFHQTENDYLILVYYKGINERNHRLIGAELINNVLPQPRLRP